MKFPNRIDRYYAAYILSFILTASSILNIQANTNPENGPTITSVQAASNPDASTTQEPVEIHLNILAGMCEHALEAIEKGTWSLPHSETEKTVLNEMIKETLVIAVHCLKTFEGKAPDINTQYLYEIVIKHQLLCITDLLLRNTAAKSDLEALITAAQEKPKTIDDLAQAIESAHTAFETLHATFQNFGTNESGAHGNTTHDAKEKSQLDRTNDAILKQLCVVDSTLEELAQFIDNQSLNVPDRASALDAIRAVRKTIEERKYDRGQVTEQSLYNLLTLNKYLIHHVRTMIQSNFANLPALDETALTTRTKRDVTFEEIDTKYQDNEKILAEMRIDSQSAGLKRYNVIARQLEPYWAKTLDGGRRILWPALGLFVATTTAHYLGMWPSRWDFDVPFLGMKYFGKAWSEPFPGAVTVPPDHLSDRGVIGNLTNVGPRLATNPVILVPAGLAAYYGMGDFKRAKSAVNDLITRASNFLLGRKAVKTGNEITHIEPKYTFKDVIGQQEIKDTLSTIVRYFEDPQGIDNRGLKLEKGYLFTGGTRSGKSFMAEALAGEIRASLKRAGKDEKAFKLIVAPAEILRQPGGFELCMAHARRNAPCILFIDEIHLLDLQAGKNSALLGEFLTQLSGVMTNDPESKVFVIAATNKEGALDKALTQPGRLSKEIRFKYPTYGDRRAFTVNILEKRSINVQSDKWAHAINQFARESEGCTYEALRKAIEGAFITAKFNGESLEPAHLTTSFDDNIRGIRAINKDVISRQERERVAAQQTGYVIATKILAPNLSIAKVTTLRIEEGIMERSLWSQWSGDKNEDPKTDQREMYGRIFTYGKTNHETLRTMQEHINACTIAVAGHAAGNVLLGVHNNATLPREKGQEALEVAKKAISNGMNIDEFNDTLKTEFLKRAMALRYACERKAALVMTQNPEALKAIYTALLNQDTLTGNEIDAILSAYTLVSPDAQDAAINNILDTDAHPA